MQKMILVTNGFHWAKKGPIFSLESEVG